MTHSATSTLRTWRDRARPEQRVLLRALAGGLGAALVSSWLLTAAVTLLVFSATRPTWRSVAAWLVVVEILAFVRAPLRFNERLSSHTLGYDAVTTWRRWLVQVVGRWSTTTWASQGTGDIADRALNDTDALSDLWVRGMLPLLTAGVTLAVGDAATAVLTWHQAWWLGPVLLAGQVIGACGLRLSFGALVRSHAVVRHRRGQVTTQIIDGASVVHDLALLGASDLVAERVDHALGPLERAEQRTRRLTRLGTVVALLITLWALGAVWLASPTLQPLLVVALAWLAIGSADLFDSAHHAVQSLVSVTASGERLDALDVAAPIPVQSWPPTATITWTHRGHERTLSPQSRIAITGDSGSGKTTLLQVLAGLSDAESPLLVNGLSVSTVIEPDVRRHVRFVPADPQLVRGYVRDVLGMGSPVPDSAWQWLHDLGLSLEQDQRLEQLSRGERQRFAVVRSLVTSPLLVLLDEPTGGLGVDDTQRLLNLLSEVGVAVIVATHDPLVIAWCNNEVALP